MKVTNCHVILFQLWPVHAQWSYVAVAAHLGMSQIRKDARPAPVFNPSQLERFVPWFLEHW